jgi:hypothetical protein
MKRFTMFASLALALVFAISSFAGELPQYTKGNSTIYGGATNFAKASRDTFVMIGPWGTEPATKSVAWANGQFQDQSGLPAWNGWTHSDLTQPTITHWQLGTYAPRGSLNGSQWAWCGDADIPSCGGDDPVGGYGNGWNDLIEWRGTVANNSTGVTVTFTATANIDSEPGYDGTEIVYFDTNGRQVAAYYDGLQPGITLNANFALAPVDYQGPGSDEVVVQVQFQSDGGWSDAEGDCQWPTGGAIQIDDITVTMDQGTGVVSSFTDFESGWGDWAVGFPVGVGDFAQIWIGLDEIDPCHINFSPQVAFIDDGQVVPGVDGPACARTGATAPVATSSTPPVVPPVRTATSTTRSSLPSFPGRTRGPTAGTWPSTSTSTRT